MKKIKELLKMKFIQNVLILVSGTAAVQVLNLASSPIITRLYGPEAFGILGIFLATITILSPIVSLTYPSAIVLPQENREAKGISYLSLYISLFMAIIIGIIIYFFNEIIIQTLNLQVIGSLIFLFPIVVLLLGFLQVMEQVLIRERQFKVTAKAMFLNSLITNGSKISVGLFHPFTISLIIISILGNATHSLFMFLGSRKKLQDYKNVSINFKLLKELGKKYRNFPLFRAPEAFISTISRNLPLLLLSAFFGPSIAGFFTLASNVLSQPTALISHSVGNVFYQRIAEAERNGEPLTPLLLKTTLGLLLLGILPFGAIIIIGPELFQTIFGAEWRIAGDYARWLALWSFFMFTSNTSFKILPVLSEQLFHLKFTVFTLIIRILTMTIAYYLSSDDLIVVIFFAISGAVFNIVAIILTLIKCRNFDNK